MFRHALFWIISAFIIGAFTPFQAGMNAELRKHLGHPFLAGIWNCASAAIFLIVVALFARITLPTWTQLTNAPWWAWLGGLIGGTYIIISLISAPKLGALLLMATLITGTLIASIVIDHFGLVGYPIRPITPYRIMGIFTLFLGLFLIQKG